MTLETITLAVGPKETKRTEELKRALLDVAVPTDAMVVLLHVFSESAYREGVVEAGYDRRTPRSRTPWRRGSRASTTSPRRSTTGASSTASVARSAT